MQETPAGRLHCPLAQESFTQSCTRSPLLPCFTVNLAQEQAGSCSCTRTHPCRHSLSLGPFVAMLLLSPEEKQGFQQPPRPFHAAGAEGEGQRVKCQHLRSGLEQHSGVTQCSPLVRTGHPSTRFAARLQLVQGSGAWACPASHHIQPIPTC